MAAAAADPWAAEVEGAGGLTLRDREALSTEDLIRVLHVFTKRVMFCPYVLFS